MTADVPIVPPEHEGDVTLFALAHDASGVAVGSGWTDLNQRGLLHVGGADAEVFLQGQLTQDMGRVRAGRSLLAAHCTPKGRVSTLFRAWPCDDGFLLDCPAALQASALRRLRLYVLRARVVITEVADQWHRVGLYGEQAADWLTALDLPVVDHGSTLMNAGAHRMLRMGPTRWQVLSPRAPGLALAAGLAATSGQATNPQGWQLASVRAGEPEVLPGSVEAFIPQMLNLDQLDGVSFRKGCYTGQEIVARSHYLGKVKRRMQHLAYQGATAPQAGQAVPLAGVAVDPAVAPREDDSAAAVSALAHGEIVYAVQTHAEGGEALAVVRVIDTGTAANTPS